MKSDTPTIADEISISQTETLQAWGWRWTLPARWRHLFEHDRAVPWLTLQDFPGAELLKQNALRSVWRVRLPEGVVVAKIYQPLRGLQWLKALFTGHPAKREYQAAVYCQRHDLSVIKPVAYGRLPGARGGGPYVLLTEEVPSAANLSDDWLSRTKSVTANRRAAENAILVQLASWLAELHHNGVLPFDLHPDNILVQSSAETPHITLVDLHKLRYGKRVWETERLGNLAQMNQWFQHNATGISRLRFLFAYLTHYWGMPSPRVVKRYAEDVSLLTEWDAAGLHEKRDRRIFGDNRYFGVLKLPENWHAHVFLRSKRPIPGSRCSHIRFTKEDWQNALPLVTRQLVDDKPAEIEVGRHRIAIDLEQIGRSPGRLHQRWRDSHRRINRRQPSAVPLALLERRTVGRAVESMLITEREAQP